MDPQNPQSLKDLLKPKEKSTNTEKVEGKVAEGLAFEKEINLTCELYRLKKIAFIQKFDPPTRFVAPKPGQPGKGFFVKGGKAGFDFVGAVIETKSPIFIECKSTEKGSLPLWQEDSGLKKHQIEILMWLADAGFTTMVLWKVRKAGIVYKFSITQLIEKLGVAKSLTVADCEDLNFERLFKIKIGLTEYYDFLNKLEE